MKARPLVEVFWLDAGVETMEMSEESVVEITPLLRKNAGYLLMNTKEKVVLCFGHISDREKHGQVWDTTMVIPKGCITKIVRY